MKAEARVCVVRGALALRRTEVRALHCEGLIHGQGLMALGPGQHEPGVRLIHPPEVTRPTRGRTVAYETINEGHRT